MKAAVTIAAPQRSFARQSSFMEERLCILKTLAT
jgi:hypothetical protein